MLHYLKILRQRVTWVFLSKFYLSGFTVFVFCILCLYLTVVIVGLLDTNVVVVHFYFCAGEMSKYMFIFSLELQ